MRQTDHLIRGLKHILDDMPGNAHTMDYHFLTLDETKTILHEVIAYLQEADHAA